MKDPAFLFYPSDFFTGTFLMSDEQVGKYIRLLCLQHINKGILTKSDMLKICGGEDPAIFSKFKKDDEGNFFNERLQIEMNKRANYTESRRKNAQKNKNLEQEHLEAYASAYAEHMGNINENININESDKIEIKKENKKNEIDFISKVIECFREAYDETRGREYQLTNLSKERSAAGKILGFYKKKNPDATHEETLNGLTEYFKNACNVNDTWLYNNMSLPILLSKFNQVNQILDGGAPAGKLTTFEKNMQVLNQIKREAEEERKRNANRYPRLDQEEADKIIKAAKLEIKTV